MMPPAARKAAFRKLSSGHGLDDLALLLGVSVDTLRGWHKPSNPRAPSDEHLLRLRKVVIADLTKRIRSLDVIANGTIAA
ncbi:hypothetical protein [Rhizobium leguminosarum]|uniref:hypothetical protein n=1 Tax=Rhizobium leguminosarum TaxID=384 RepID=UPI001441B622|nr:hypothetical protein [Rhizobium leguminosarum]NKJ77746.1 hypothetical protein [Rhizobium leguminosarum bv. viciae]